MTDQLQLLLRQLTTSQRIGIAFGTFASLLLLVGFVMWAGKPDLQPAFSRLTNEDAAAISEALRTAKVPFELADAGTTILVPAAQLSAARVAAGAAGLSTGGDSGFEVFDKQNFGASEFDQNVAYQRAIEGKLAKTIKSMSGVAEATVSVVAMQKGLFADQDRPASASVNVKMRGGAAPDGAMVRGIVSTVSGSVAGLTTSNVTVVDERGRVLAGPENELGGDTFAIQSSVERGLSAKVQELVDQALGPGHASVAVSADLDLDHVEQQVTTVKPIDAGNWTPTSVQRIGEIYSGSAATGASGIPGAGSNVPGLPTYPGTVPAPASPDPGASPTPDASPGASIDPNANSGYTRQQETVNYANSQTVERIIKQPGAIQRLSVAVLLDQDALGSVTPDGLRESIVAAIGASEARGDIVSVSSVPFKGAATAEPDSGGGDLIGSATGIASTVIGSLIAVLLLFVVWRNLRALRARADEMQLIAGASNQELLGAYTATGQAASLAPAAEFAGGPQARIRDRLQLVADEKPDALVGLMQGWLRDDQTRR